MKLHFEKKKTENTQLMFKTKSQQPVPFICREKFMIGSDNGIIWTNIDL